MGEKVNCLSFARFSCINRVVVRSTFNGLDSNKYSKNGALITIIRTLFVIAFQ